LVENYFPKASHQVIILSTDEEINGKYYDTLKKSIGKTYLLEFDDTNGHTKIFDGYFQ
jgi:DNA sulfur modification protein DndD